MAEHAVGATDALDTDEPEQPEHHGAGNACNGAESSDTSCCDNDQPEGPADESSAEHVDDDSVPPAGSDAAHTRPRGFRPVIVTLAVVAVGLATLLAVFGVQYWQHQQQTDRREAATNAAQQVARQLTSISYKTADQDLEELLDASTGKFRKQFADRMKPFIDVIKKSQVETSGKVVETGVERLGESSARVLVATHSEVKNTQAKSPQPRNYRLRITTTHVDGRWLASNVEFVS